MISPTIRASVAVGLYVMGCYMSYRSGVLAGRRSASGEILNGVAEFVTINKEKWLHEANSKLSELQAKMSALENEEGWFSGLDETDKRHTRDALTEEIDQTTKRIERINKISS